MEKRLTTLDYWNKQYQWTGHSSRINPFVNLAVAELDKVLKKFLPSNEAFMFLEVGCAPGIWMDYFYRTFHYNVEGIEYTERGVEKTTKNLEKLGTPHKVYYQDFFNNTLSSKYDVVFSGGFVEHFEDAEDAIKKHISLLKNGGIAVIEIPNLAGWNGNLQKRLNKEIQEKHNTKIMNEEFFKSVAENLSVDVLFIGYVGKINFGLFQGGRIIGIFFSFLQSLLTTVYEIFRGRIFIPDSKMVSPYLVAIYKKPIN